MEQNPYTEPKSHSSSQEIPHPLWNLKSHYRVHKSPQLVSILSQMLSVYTFLLYLSKIHSNISR